MRRVNDLCIRLPLLLPFIFMCLGISASRFLPPFTGLARISILCFCITAGVILLKSSSWKSAPFFLLVGAVLASHFYFKGGVVPFRTEASLLVRAIERPRFFDGKGSFEADIVDQFSGALLPENKVKIFFKGRLNKFIQSGSLVLIKGTARYVRHRGNEFRDRLVKGDHMLVLWSREDSIVPLYDDYEDPWILKEKVRMAVAKVGSLNARGVLGALVLGDRFWLDREVSSVFRRAGAAHLLAVSGLHVASVFAFLYFFAFFILSRTGVVKYGFDIRPVSSLFAAAGCILYAGFVSFSPPTLRAVSTLVLFIIVSMQGRKVDSFNILLAVLVGILLFYPDMLFSPSFQLSAAAAGGILLAVRRKGEEEGKIKKFLKVSTAAWLFTLGIAAYHFGSISIWTVVTNTVLVPLYSLIVLPLALIGALISFLFVKAGAFILSVSGIFIDLSLGFMKVISNLPAADFKIPCVDIWFLFIWYFVCVVIFLNLKAKRKILYVLIVLLIFFTWGRAALRPLFSRGVSVEVLDVGQGDCVFIDCSGKTMLIDSGPLRHDGTDEGMRTVVPYLLRKGVLHLDYMILTHPDSDHIGGALKILNNIRVRNLLYSCRFDQTKWKKILEMARKKGSVVLPVTAGQKLSVGPCSVEFWHADCNLNFSDNALSLVTKLDVFGRSFLFPGDIPGFLEAKLPDYLFPVDILMLPHHGSPHSSTDVFLDRASPLLSVTSSGFANYFGFPSPDLVSKLDLRGIDLFRTDMEGKIRFTVKRGGRIQVFTFRGGFLREIKDAAQNKLY